MALTRAGSSRFRTEARLLIREHWTRERITLVVLGLVCFYVTYVSYRNLKNFLPFVRGGQTRQGDYELHKFDQWLMFGNDPAIVLHNVLGTTVSAHVLSWVYLIFLPMVPISVTIWLVWSRNVSFGYWYVTAQCICWTLGTASYYMIPTLGPELRVPLALQRARPHRRHRSAESACTTADRTFASTRSPVACSRWPGSRPCTSP